MKQQLKFNRYMSACDTLYVNGRQDPSTGRMGSGVPMNGATGVGAMHGAGDGDDGGPIREVCRYRS